MSTPSDLKRMVWRPDGSVDIDALARILLVTRVDLAFATGLSRATDCRSDRGDSAVVQHRMLELVSILERVLPWVSHPRLAFAWYRSQPLVSFGGMTAEDMVKMGRASAIQDYLARIHDGGYS